MNKCCIDYCISCVMMALISGIITSCILSINKISESPYCLHHLFVIRIV